MFGQFYLHSLAKLLLDCLPISVNFSSIFYHFFTHFWSIFIQIFTNYWSISARFSTVFHQFLVNVTHFHQFYRNVYQFLINFMSILCQFFTNFWPFFVSCSLNFYFNVFHFWSIPCDFFKPIFIGSILEFPPISPPNFHGFFTNFLLVSF